MKRFFKYALIVILVIGISLFIAIKIILDGVEFGGKLEGESLEKAKNSPQYNGDHFQNIPEAIPNNLWVSIQEMRGDEIRKSPLVFPMQTPTISDTVGIGLKATWFGHAAVYVEMDGKRIMTDPMLSDLAFPVKMVAPERFNPPAMRANELPPIDFVTISHDHFDHLDMKSVVEFAKNGTKFFVGLGIKAHLQRWQIPDDQIYEMDWNESIQIDDFTIHCMPARHYSGRTGMNNSTLWTSWVIESPNHKIYHSGDSGYGPHFKEIGAQFGSIDFGFIKVGDYGDDAGWRDIHMHTEYSIEAAKDINASVLFPIHWGTFALSYHDWYEPINLTVEYSETAGINYVTPKLGETITFGEDYLNVSWWKEIEEMRTED
ncbi:MAG: MBL fold metallo-hydrolase [Balneolaceae bacterium]